jgi:putative flippase GtrA
MFFLKEYKFRPYFIQFFKFGIVGLSNTIIGYTVYAILVYLDFYYVLANAISFVVGIANSFFWNNKFVFKNDGKRNILFSFLKTFVSYAITGLILTSLLLFLFVDILKLSRYYAFFLCLIVTVPSNFCLNKFWAFKNQI